MQRVTESICCREYQPILDTMEQTDTPDACITQHEEFTTLYFALLCGELPTLAIAIEIADRCQEISRGKGCSCFFYLLLNIKNEINIVQSMKWKKQKKLIVDMKRKT